jgi:putative FmdB family regulatory protein
MPVYVYQCENCGVRFERYQQFSEPPLIRCPECSKKSLRKVYTPVGIVFKGSGFYATDNRSPSGNGRANGSAKTEGEDNSTSASNSTSTTESTTSSE